MRFRQPRITEFLMEREHKRYENKKNYTIPWGDTHLHKKGTRLVFNNVNGIPTVDNMAKVHIIAMQAIELKCDILGLAETNLDWNFRNANATVKSIISKYWNAHRIATSSSDYTFGSYVQPGGTCSLARGPLAMRFRPNKDSSKLGRWSELQICGKDRRKLTVIVAYSVCDSRISRSGPSTAYTQQWHLLKHQNVGVDPQPKVQGMLDLAHRIRQLQDLGHEVIVMLDANATIQKPNSPFPAWVRSLQLIDIHMLHHGTEDEPSTYARGPSRLDYILMTEGISEYVSACGILPIHELCLSDHRPLFVDVDLDSFLGHTENPMVSKANRRLNSNDPRMVKRYQELLAAELDKSQLESQLDCLDKVESALSTEQLLQLEGLDEAHTAMRLRCEKQSSRDNRYPWSPTFRKASFNHMFWKTWLSEIQLNNGTSLLQSRSRYVTDENSAFLYGIPRCGSLAIRSFINNKLKAAQQEIRHAKAFASELRDQFLQDQAAMYATNGQKDLTKIIHNIRSNERRRRTFIKLRRIVKPEIRTSLECLLLKDSDGYDTRCYDSRIIDEVLLERNTRHFSQADITPFATDPLRSHVGPYGTSTFCDQVLDGSANIDTLDIPEAAREILRHLYKDPATPDIPSDISTPQLIQAYTRWNEDTTTSPSGLHLGHDKAVLRYQEGQRSTARETQTDPLYERVFDIKSRLLNLAIRNRHTYRRWTYVVNAMIEKIPGTPYPDKMRVIHLLESDFNMAIGILWGKRAVYQGESLHMFDPGQGGSRPGKRTHELLVNKHLTYSIWRLTKSTGSSFDNDAKSCFDRIVMTLASLCSQQVGLKKEACEFFLRTLSLMQYHVKTAYGVSGKSYGSSADHTIHGPGQGGRGSPCIWLLISSLIMKCMRKVNGGAMFRDPFTSAEFTLMITGFVDDITHWYASLGGLGHAELVRTHMQITAQAWERLLHSTGGKLELSKCFYYLMDWHFDQQGIEFLAPHEESPIDIIDSETFAPVQIPRRNVKDSHKTLGVFETPSGDYHDENQRLRLKARGFAQRVSASTLSPEEARILYFTMFLPSINYSGVIGVLMEGEANNIQAAATKQCLARMGYNRCLPNAIAYGPSEVGGVGLRHLFAEQGSIKACFILRMTRVESDTGRIIRCQLRWVQRVVGLSKSILEDTSRVLPHLRNELWITTLRKFLSLSRSQLILQDLMEDERQCINDEYLMDIVLQLRYTPNEVIMINRCRLYLHAVTVSDIVNAKGTHVTTQAYTLQPGAVLQSQTSWPRQPHVGKQHLRIWKHFVRTLCHEQSYKLLQPMGQWTVSQIRCTVSTVAYYDDSRHMGFILHNGIWHSAEFEPRRTFSVATRLHPIDGISVDHLLPVDIIDERRNAVFHVAWRGKHRKSEKTSPISSWDEYILTLHGWIRYILADTNIYSMERLKEAVQQSITPLTVVSAGGAATCRDSFAWILLWGEFVLATGSGDTFGSPNSPNRTSHIGRLSWMQFVMEFRRYAQVQFQCRIVSFCQNSVTIKRTNHDNNYASSTMSLTKDFDVLNEMAVIQRILSDDGIIVCDTEFIAVPKIRGRQSIQHTGMQHLVTDVVNQASLRQTTFTGMAPSFSMDSCTCYLVVNDVIQSSNELYSLRWNWSKEVIYEYYKSKWCLTDTTMQDINWNGIRFARRRLSRGQLTFSIKDCIDWLPTGIRLHKYGNIIASCPMCVEEESGDHLYQCESRRNAVQQKISKFREYLFSLNTSPIITNVLCDGLTTWIQKGSEDIIDWGPLATKLYQAQRKIGWRMVVRGFLSKEFANEQSQFGAINNRLVNGDQWSSQVSTYWIATGYEIWTERNENMHATGADILSRCEEEVFARVQRLYDSKSKLSSIDMQLLDMPLEERLMQPMRSLKLWLSQTTTTVSKCIASYYAILQQQNRKITEYFVNADTPMDSVEERKEENDGSDVIHLHQSQEQNILSGCTSLSTCVGTNKEECAGR